MPEYYLDIETNAIMENSYLRDIYSERIEDDKLNIIIQDLKEELKNIYGDESRL